MTQEEINFEEAIGKLQDLEKAMLNNVKAIADNLDQIGVTHRISGVVIQPKTLVAVIDDLVKMHLNARKELAEIKTLLISES